MGFKEHISPWLPEQVFPKACESQTAPCPCVHVHPKDGLPGTCSELRAQKTDQLKLMLSCNPKQALPQLPGQTLHEQLAVIV